MRIPLGMILSAVGLCAASLPASAVNYFGVLLSEVPPNNDCFYFLLPESRSLTRSPPGMDGLR